MERYSNGKEPHWKCGVPQGIVRSSRILSAKGQTNCLAFFHISANFLLFPAFAIIMKKAFCRLTLAV